MRKKWSRVSKMRYILIIIGFILVAVIGFTVAAILRTKATVSIFLSSWNNGSDVTIDLRDSNISVMWTPWATYVKVKDIRFGNAYDYLTIEKFTLVYPLRWLYFSNGSFYIDGLKKMQLVLNEKNVYNIWYDTAPRISIDKNDDSKSFKYIDNVLKFTDSDGNIISSTKSNLKLSFVKNDDMYHYDFAVLLAETPSVNLKCAKCKLFGELTRLGSVQISLTGNGIVNEIDRKGIGHMHTLNVDGKLLTDVNSVEMNGVLRFLSTEKNLIDISKKEFNLDIKIKSYQKFIDDMFNIASYTKDSSKVSNHELSGLYNVITKSIIPFVKNNGNIPQQKDDLRINLSFNGEHVMINGIKSTLVLQALL